MLASKQKGEFPADMSQIGHQSPEKNKSRQTNPIRRFFSTTRWKNKPDSGSAVGWGRPSRRLEQAPPNLSPGATTSPRPRAPVPTKNQVSVRPENTKSCQTNPIRPLFSTLLARTNPIPGPAGVTGVRTRTPRRPATRFRPISYPGRVEAASRVTLTKRRVHPAVAALR
jgi:hypothetical protein